MLKKFFRPIIFTAINAVYFGFVAFAQAQAQIVSIPNPLGQTSTLAGFINLLLSTLLPIAATISVFFMIYSGFLMVTAGSNEEKLGKAKTTFLWTVIGIGVLLGAKVLSAVVCGTIQQLGTFSLSCITP